MTIRQREATVTFGEGDTVVVRRSARHPPVVAKALDIERGEDGRPVRVLLDRRVHREDEDWCGEWRASGAIVSLLERPALATGKEDNGEGPE